MYVYVGMGDQVLALIFTTCVYEGETECLHSLILHVCVHKGDPSACTNKTLGRALDPRANGTWLSKLTE